MKTSKLSWAALAASAVVMFAGPATASAADFTIFDGTKTSPVLIDAAYGGEHADRDYGRCAARSRTCVRMSPW